MEAAVKIGTSSLAGEVCMSATKTSTKYTHTSLTESSTLHNNNTGQACYAACVH